jgi:hypothetical protein
MDIWKLSGNARNSDDVSRQKYNTGTSLSVVAASPK